MEIFTNLINFITGAKALFGGDTDEKISDAADKEFDTSELKSLGNKLQTRLNSINKEARKSTFDFPVLFSDTIPADLIFGFKESLENNYAQLLKIYLENIGMIKLDKGETKQTFLKRVRNLMLEEVTEDYDYISNEDLLAGLNTKDIDGFKVINEAKDGSYNHVDIGQRLEKRDVYKNTTFTKEKRVPKRDKKGKIIKDKDGNVEYEWIPSEREDKSVYDTTQHYTVPNSPNDKYSRNVAYFASQSDVDKKNSKMEPTRFTIQIVMADDQGAVINQSIRIGVKVHPIVVKSESILRNLPKAKFDENFFIRAARTLTKEKGFFKYFLLRVDDAKKVFKHDDAWYHNMRIDTSRDKLLSKWQSGVKFANSTFIITLEEAEEMRRESKFDILAKEDSILRSMDALGIITFIVVDQARERIMRITDTYRKWEFLSFKEIEGESKGMSDRDMLKIVLAAQGVK